MIKICDTKDQDPKEKKKSKSKKRKRNLDTTRKISKVKRRLYNFKLKIETLELFYDLFK